MKDLNDIVNDAIDAKRAAGVSFSAWDITQKCREIVNQSSIKFDIDSGDAGDEFYEHFIGHNDVNYIVSSMFYGSVLTRQHNGKFYEYEVTNTTNTTNTPNGVSAHIQIVSDLMYSYLKRNGSNTAKYIQGTINRFWIKSDPISVADIAKAIDRFPNLFLCYNRYDCNTKLMVHLLD